MGYPTDVGKADYSREKNYNAYLIPFSKFNLQRWYKETI